MSLSPQKLLTSLLIEVVTYNKCSSFIRIWAIGSTVNSSFRPDEMRHFVVIYCIICQFSIVSGLMTLVAQISSSTLIKKWINFFPFHTNFSNRTKIILCDEYGWMSKVRAYFSKLAVTCESKFDKLFEKILQFTMEEWP